MTEPLTETPETILLAAVAEAQDERNAANALAEAQYDRRVSAAAQTYGDEVQAANDLLTQARLTADRARATAHQAAHQAYRQVTGHDYGQET